VHSRTVPGENRLLQNLSSGALAQVEGQFKKTSLEQGTILHESGASIEDVYFPTSGLVSIVMITQSGDAIETAVIGREGIVGADVGIEGALSFGQSIVQISGFGWRIGAAEYLKILESNDAFRTRVNRFHSVITFQAQQSAACHAFHSIEARLCRWLLHASDTVGGNNVNLTQEFLSQMLGCQRSSVNLAVQELRQAGFTRSRRGRIEGDAIA
jgi:CRP-like cAMP-binding protein